MSRDEIIIPDSNGEFASIDGDPGEGGAGIGTVWHDVTLGIGEGFQCSVGRVLVMRNYC